MRRSREEILGRIVWREALDDPVRPGYSGAKLERARLDDGSRIVIKRMSPETDLTMRITDDSGRAVEMWLGEAADRMPRGVDHAVVGGWKEDGAWVMVMRDVSEALLAEGRVLDRGENRRILDAMEAYHAAFAGAPPAGACALGVHLRSLSPETVGALGSDAPIVRSILHGWRAFEASMPVDVVEAVQAVHAEPAALVAALARGGTTLIHGDPWLANIGLEPDGVVFLDWSMEADAPAELDFALYVLGNWELMELSREELIAEYRSVRGGRFDQEMLDLCCLAAFAEYGWLTAQSAAHGDGRHRADGDWWVEAARRGLDAWRRA